MRYVAKPATLEDAVYVAQNLRKEDFQEVETASGGRPPVAVLVDSLEVSREVYAATLEGDEKPFLLFGVADDPMSQAGIVWLLATDRVNTARIMVVRAAAEWLQKWGHQYLALHNYVDKRNTLHVRWLRLMGFEFDYEVIRNGKPFLHFIQYTGGQPCANRQLSSLESAQP